LALASDGPSIANQSAISINPRVEHVWRKMRVPRDQITNIAIHTGGETV